MLAVKTLQRGFACFVSRPPSGGSVEVQAALFVELLGGAEVERFARDGAAQSLAGDVAQRAVLPRISHGKEDGSVAAHEDVFLARSNGRALDRSTWCGRGFRGNHADAAARRLVGPDFFGICRRRFVFDYGRNRWERESAAKEGDESAEVGAVMLEGVGMGGSEVDEIEA